MIRERGYAIKYPENGLISPPKRQFVAKTSMIKRGSNGNPKK